MKIKKIEPQEGHVGFEIREEIVSLITTAEQLDEKIVKAEQEVQRLQDIKTEIQKLQ